MNPRLEELCAKFPEFDDDYSPPWGLPTSHDFDRIRDQFACEFPQSYIDFQTEYAARLPVRDNGFVWGNADLEPYLSLESTIESARDWGVAPHYVPFSEDEGNFYCFDTSLGDDKEYPVVFWDHDEGRILDVAHCKWDSFYDWLVSRLEHFRS